MKSVPQTVFVTGATGFVGKRLCAYLIDNGFKVRALTRQLNPALHYNSKIEWVVGDVTKPHTLLNICDQVSIVFHLAGFAHAYEEENPAFALLHQQVNHQGTIHILNEAKRAGVKRFVYFSSVKACGSSDACIDETWTQYPTDAYGIAKREAENAVLQYCKESDILPIILRPTLVYGVGVKGNLSAMIKGVSKGYFPVPPPVQNRKSMVSVDDLCRVALLAAKAENLQHHIFIVSDNNFYSTYQMVQMIRAELGKKKSKLYLPLWVWILLAKIGDCLQWMIKKRMPINTQAVKKLFSNAAYCSQTIKNELQFEPKMTLQDALPLMIRANKANKDGF